MTLQTLPILRDAGLVDSDGNALRDLPFIGPGNTERPLFRFGPEQLDGVGFSVRMVWMQLSAIWTARQLLTRDDQIVTLGIPLTGSGVDLLAPISEPNRPAGQLWYGFEDGSTGAPGRFDWRGRASLFYRPIALVEAVAGSERALL